MAVVAGCGAQELDTLFLAPGTLTVGQAVGVGLADQVVHQAQGSVAADKGLAGLAAQNIRPVLAGALQTGQIAVVTAVVSVDDTLSGVHQGGEHIADQVQLQLAGLAAGHIQLQILLLQLVITGQHLLVFHAKLFTASASISRHIHHPFESLALFSGLLYASLRKNATSNFRKFIFTG